MTESTHKSHQVLQEEISLAGQSIQIGEVHAHYKDRKKTYKPLHFATLESNDELCVFYQAEYGSKLYFVRPVSEWLEMVEWNGQKLQRFTPVAPGL